MGLIAFLDDAMESQALVRLEDPTAYHVMPSGSNQQLTLPQPKREVRQKKVLQEEDYVSVLENIIERDYFPHLPKLRAQLQYIQSSEKFDLNVLKSIYSDLYEDSDHLFPKLKVTALSGDDLSVDERSTTIDPNHLTVSSFFERFTSEDNKSFEKIAEKNLKAFQKKFHWAYENMDHLLIEDKPTSNHKSILHGEQNAAIAQQKKKAGMLMLYYIGDKILSVEERQKMDKILERHHEDGNSNSIKDRMNSIENWNFRVRNQLFFQPELSDSYDTCQVPLVTNSSSSSSSGSNGGGGDVVSSENKPVVQRSILPAPHAPVALDQLLLHSSTSYEIERQNASLLVVHTGSAASMPPKQSVNFNNMPDKIIQKNNTHLENNWFLSMPPPSTTPSRISSLGLGVSSEYESFDSDTDTESVMRNKQQQQQALLNKNKRYRPVSLDTSSVQSFPMAPPTSAPLHTLTDEQLLRRYQELAQSHQSHAQVLSSNIKFSMPPTSQRDVLARKLDKPGKSVASAVYGIDATSMGDGVSVNSTLMRSVVGSAARGTVKTGPVGGGNTVYSSSSSKRKLSDLSPAAQSLALKLQKKRTTL